MKEDLICGVAILLYLVLLYLLTTIFIKTGEAVDRYKMKKKTDKIKVGQRYKYKNYFKDPFERGKHVIKILIIKEGYALYEYEEKLYIRSSESLEDIVKKYILITDIE
jgi:hypothetical protein